MQLGALGGMLPLPLGGSAESGWYAADHARVCADLVACSRTLPFAILNVHVLPGASPGGELLYYLGQNGAGIDYGPTILWNGTGDYYFTWQRSYADAYGIQEPVNITMAEVTPSPDAPSSIVGEAFVIQPHIIRVRTTTSNTGLDVNSDLQIEVW